MKRPALPGGRTDSAALLLFCGVSLIIHVVALITWVVVSQTHKPQIDLDKAVIKTKLVKLGKKRDERLMPRLVRKKPPKPSPKKPPPPKPTPAKPVPQKPATQPKTPPPPKPKSTQDILKSFADETTEPDPRPSLSDLIKKTVLDDEGHEQGSRFGEEMSGKLKASYNDRILARFRSHHTAPNTLTDAERIRLKTRVFLRINATGGIVDAKVAKSSGNNAFDN